MFKSLFAATALLVVTASPVFAKDQAFDKDGAARTFTRDGETYTYTTVAKGDKIIISGTRQSNGSTFQLAVRGSRVSGVTDGVPVSFTVPDAQAAISATELAER